MSLCYQNPVANYHSISKEDVYNFEARLKIALSRVDVFKFGFVAIIVSNDPHKSKWGDIDIVFGPPPEGSLAECLIETDKLFEEIQRENPSDEYLMVASHFQSQFHMNELSRIYNGCKKQIPVHRLVFDSVNSFVGVVSKTLFKKIKGKLKLIYGSIEEFEKRKTSEVSSPLSNIFSSQADIDVAFPSQFQFENRLRMLNYLVNHYPAHFSKDDLAKLNNDSEAKELVHEYMRQL